MNRRKFVITAGQAFPVVAGAIYLVGCDSEGDDDGNGMSIVATSSVDAGHSHTAEIPEDDLDSSSEHTYQSSLNSGHTHSVVLSSAQLMELADGSSVTVTSSNSGGHTHQFTFQMTS